MKKSFAFNRMGGYHAKPLGKLTTINCRAREGTEIFEKGDKPDVIHYVNSPEVGNIDLTDKIDERTPVKVAINSEV